MLANLAATYAWDNQGRMTNMTYPSGAQLAYHYDSMGRLSQITSPNYPSQYSNIPAAFDPGTRAAISFRTPRRASITNTFAPSTAS